MIQAKKRCKSGYSMKSTMRLLCCSPSKFKLDEKRRVCENDERHRDEKPNEKRGLKIEPAVVHQPMLDLVSFSDVSAVHVSLTRIYLCLQLRNNLAQKSATAHHQRAEKRTHSAQI